MRLRLAIAVALLLASASTPTRAAATTGTAADPREPFAETVVELTLNDDPAHVTLIVRRDADGTLLLRAADLPALRLRTPARGALQVDGERYYRFGAETGARVAFDDATQSVHVVLPPSAFLPTRRATSLADAPRPQRAQPGGFLNYDVSVEQSGVLRQAGGLVELGAFGGRGVATSTVLAQADARSRSVTRLDTTWTRDFPDRLATLRVGDAISMPGSWGRAVRFAGVQFGTNFGTQPSLVTTPLLAAQGEAIVPSTVDVFVNGRRVASEDVPPGPFAIEHLPAITGRGELQVVVTDVLGRQQVISQPYYSGAALLRPGLVDYSVEAGSLRENYGKASFDYGDVIATGSYRRGFTSALTAGVHVEGSGDGTLALGGDVAWQAGQLGIVTAYGAAGGRGPQAGALAGLGLEHEGGHYSLFAHTQCASQGFQQLGTALLEHAPKQRSFAGFGLDFSRFGNLQVAYGLQSYYDDASVRTLGLTYSVTLGPYGSLGFFATRSDANDSETTVALSWTLPLGSRNSVSTAVQRSATTAGASLDAYATWQHDLPTDSGLGYRVSVSSSEEQDASVGWRGRAGMATLDYASRNGETATRLGATGGLALTTAGVLPGRHLDQSFAVVQVADYPGLTVYLDNQPVGRTDAHGRLLVDALRPYERNQIAIDPTQVPMDGALAQAAVDVTPAYRSGAVVQFPVARAHAATLRLVRTDGTAVPAGATATLQQRPFPVALDGLTYVEGLDAPATLDVSWTGGHCVASVRPAGGDVVPDLGTVRCE